MCRVPYSHLLQTTHVAHASVSAGVLVPRRCLLRSCAAIPLATPIALPLCTPVCFSTPACHAQCCCFSTLPSRLSRAADASAIALLLAMPNAVASVRCPPACHAPRAPMVLHCACRVNPCACARHRPGRGCAVRMERASQRICAACRAQIRDCKGLAKRSFAALKAPTARRISRKRPPPPLGGAARRVSEVGRGDRLLRIEGALCAGHETLTPLCDKPTMLRTWADALRVLRHVVWLLAPACCWTPHEVACALLNICLAFHISGEKDKEARVVRTAALVLWGCERQRTDHLARRICSSWPEGALSAHA